MAVSLLAVTAPTHNNVGLNQQELKELTKARQKLGITSSITKFAQVLQHGSRYKNFKYLGSGTYKVVVKATDTCSKIAVAIGISRKSAPAYISTFKKEIRNLQFLATKVNDGILKLFSNHPLIFPREGKTSQSRPCMITDFKGKNLFTQFVLGKTDITIPAFKRLCLKVLAYFQKLETLGYSQRDIKPENILTESKQCKAVTVIDYAELNKLGSSYSDEYQDSRNYRSPETLFKVNTLSQSLFSLGAVLYEVYTKEVLFPTEFKEGESREVRMARHLQKVFWLLGPPTDTFLDQLSPSVKCTYFKLSKRGAKPKYTQKLITKKSTHIKKPEKYLFTKIHRAVKTKEAGLSKRKQRMLATSISSLIYKLINFNESRKLNSLLEHPFLKTTTKVVALAPPLGLTTGKVAGIA